MVCACMSLATHENFWVITQRVVVISYRRFGATYRPHIRVSKIQEGRIFLKKYSNTKFRRNPSSGSRADTSGQTDRHYDAHGCFLRLGERKLKYKIK